MYARRELLLNGGPARFVVAYNCDKKYVEVFYIEREGGYKLEPGTVTCPDIGWVKQAIEDVSDEVTSAA